MVTEAAQAHFEYMAQGVEVPFGHTPVGQLGQWVQATHGTPPVLANQAVNVAWLRMESALTIATCRRFGMPGADSPLDPMALLDDAEDRFETVGLWQANDPISRSRAIVASGAVSLYRTLLGTGAARDTVATVDPGHMYDKQMEAARVLLRAAAQRRKDPPLHDLHVQAYLGVFNHHAVLTGAVALPVPTRLQQEGDDRSIDILLWGYQDPDNESVGLYGARVTAGESAQTGDNIILPVKLLNNSGYPSDVKQGALQALLDNDGRRPMRLAPARRMYLKGLLRVVGEHCRNQQTEGQGLVFQPASPANKLEEARRWYAGLSPLRRLTERDVPAIRQCIRPLELAYTAGKLSVEDSMALAWLRVELGNATQSSGEPTRAEFMFTALAERAEKEKDWSRYCQALAGRITAKLYGGLYSGRPTEDVLAEYRAELAELTVGLRTSLDAPEMQEAAHVAPILRLLERLTACYAITSDPEGIYIAALASPRQQAKPGSPAASDILVMPLMENGYNPQASGRMRLSAAPHLEALSYGVATFGPAPMWASLHSNPDGTYTLDHDMLEQMRTQLLEAVSPVLFV